MGQNEGATKSGFLGKEWSNYFFWDEQVIISQHKSTELVNIYWFGHSSLLLFSNIRHKTAIFPVLQKLTHILVFLYALPCFVNSLEVK